MSRSFYYPNEEFWDKFKEICKREGRKVSDHLGAFIDNYVIVHDPGNSQTLMTSYGVEVKLDSLAMIEGRLRQLCMEYSKKGTPDELRYRDVMGFAKDLITSTKTRLAVVERTVEWLHEKGVRVWR